MAKIITPLINEDIDHKFSCVYEHFIIELETLAALGLNNQVKIDPPFIHDYESIPLFRGTSKTGGTVHDYLSRYDSIPVVTKKIAADCYFEIMETSDKLKAQNNLQLVRFWLRRWAKYIVVLLWPGYFHKHSVKASYEEMRGERK